MPLYYVWSLRKCGKERKFSSIDGKVCLFLGAWGWGILFELVEETKMQ